MKTRTVIYWIATILLAFSIFSGGIAELMQLKGNKDGMALLGYPPYFMFILGTWKIFGAPVIVLPGFRRLKEWAYAGIFFNVTGAAASHIFARDYGAWDFHVWVNVLFAIFVIVSWALRPQSRILGD